MTTQQRRQAYEALRIYRLRIDIGPCLATGLRFAVVTAGAMKTREAVQGKLLAHYLVCLN